MNELNDDCVETISNNNTSSIIKTIESFSIKPNNNVIKTLEKICDIKFPTNTQPIETDMSHIETDRIDDEKKNTIIDMIQSKIQKSILSITLSEYLKQSNDFNILKIFGQLTVNEALGEVYVEDEVINNLPDNLITNEVKIRIEQIDKLSLKNVLLYDDIVEIIGPVKIVYLVKAFQELNENNKRKQNQNHHNRK